MLHILMLELRGVELEQRVWTIAMAIPSATVKFIPMNSHLLQLSLPSFFFFFVSDGKLCLHL